MSDVKGAVTCPNCGKRGPIEQDFGTRQMRGETWLQSWCRECRAKRVERTSEPMELTPAPEPDLGAIASTLFDSPAPDTSTPDPAPDTGSDYFGGGGESGGGGASGEF
jgi:uncharacterized membrane protein YgcG